MCLCMWIRFFIHYSDQIFPQGPQLKIGEHLCSPKGKLFNRQTNYISNSERFSLRVRYRYGGQIISLGQYLKKPMEGPNHDRTTNVCVRDVNIQ